MSLVTVKTNFTSGQVSPQLYGRGDLKVYANGARRLENILIFPTGGISRRHGLRHIAEINPSARLVSFEFNSEQTYLLCFEPGKLKIFKDGSLIKEITAPWNASQLKTINWTQSADTLLVVHPDVPPKQISRYDNENWRLEDWSYYQKDGSTYCPYYNFYQKKIKLTPGGTSGDVSLTSDTAVFDAGYVNLRIRINDGEGTILSVTDSKNARLKITKTLKNTEASDTWEEQAFSAKRGYPISVTFHQDRMVIGGSRSLPNRLWLSKSSDLFNFDIGTGLDDEAIDFAILSDQVNAITNVVSTRHLLVFTTGAEWMVSGEPLTPSSIQLNRQTSVGTYRAYSLPPQNVDGATLFVSQTGRQLREFLYADVEQAYQARDLTLLANDIIRAPRDIAYHQDASVLYIVQDDGNIACLTTYRTEEVNAWSSLTTSGDFLSVAVIGDDIYFAVLRGNKAFLELMDKNYQVDCGKTLTSSAPQKVWTGLNYLEGREVSILADGFTVGKFTVTDGQVTLREEASKIIIGLPYEHVIEPLPFMVDSALPYPPKAVRVVSGIFRLLETRALRINLGSGYCDVPLKKLYRDKIMDAPADTYTGDVELHALGWVREMQKPLWSIRSDKPCPFTLLGCVLEVKVK